MGLLVLALARAICVVASFRVLRCTCARDWSLRLVTRLGVSL